MKIKRDYVLHRDGTVTVWNVYTQSWLRRCARLSDGVLASLSWDEREKVERHLSRGKAQR